MRSCCDALFPEFLLKAGDKIDKKGKRILSSEIYKGMLFVQDHSGIFVVCRIEAVAPQIIFNDGTRERGYAMPEDIDYKGKDFESCVFWHIPEHWERLEIEL